MGLIKRQLLKVIKCDLSQNQIVKKFEYDDRYAIMKGSELIVMPSQAAIFVYQGSICDVFTEGHHKLEEGSTPVLTAIANWKYAFENPKQVDVYYVNLANFTGMKWGTPNPIMMRDKDFGMVRISGHGEYSFKVTDPVCLMKACAGTIHSYSTENIQDHLKGIVISCISDVLGECKIPALDLAANYIEIGDQVKGVCKEKFLSFGLEVTQVVIRNFKLPENVEKAMDKRTEVGMFSGAAMASLAQYESIGAMRDAAKNNGAGGAFAGMGIGFGAGRALGQEFASDLSAAKTPAAKCAKCGASIPAQSKFCPECGTAVQAEAKATSVCPKCGKSVEAGAKFCPECGEKMEAAVSKCPKCGNEVKAGLKFCPECGQRL